MKASNNAARSWQSTYAVLHLIDDYISTDIKDGFQKNNHYVKLYKLVYNFQDHNNPYLNFSVEIVFGRKTTGILVQYSIE